MSATLAPPLPRQGRTHAHVPHRVGAESIEIFASDRQSTNLLLEFVAPLFEAEIAPGFVWIVRLQPPATGEAWIAPLLAVVRLWLEAARLPWANIVYDGHSYLIRPSGDIVGISP
jgi:hypothetical protein